MNVAQSVDVILVLPMFVDSDDGHCGLVYFVLPMMVNILYRKLQICSIACLGESFFFFFLRWVNPWYLLIFIFCSMLKALAREARLRDGVL